MNIFNPALFAVRAPCMPCCTPTPTECPCALLLPYTSGLPVWRPAIPVFPSYADALSAVTTGTPINTTDCIFGSCYGSLYLQGFTTNPVSYSEDVSVENELSSAFTVAQSQPLFVVSLSTLAGAIISVDFTLSASGSEVSGVLWDCEGNPIDFPDSVSGTSGTLIFSPIPSDGIYIILLQATFGGSPNFTVTYNITLDDTTVFNPVIALWDDSGTTRQLEACPNMLLPPLTESSGDWYVDCATAAAVMASIQVSNCIGYSDDSFSTTFAFTATDAGTSLTLAGSANAGVAGLVCWASLNAEVGKTITVTWSNSLGGAAAIYDQYGNFVDGNTPFGDPSAFTSMALPATGRYTIYTQQFTDLTNPPGSAIITSSGTMSVNPVQSLYDVGLDCPARLTCGDSCP